jgi:hypothetical protein
VRSLERRGEGGELIVGHGLLDQREEDAFLVADVLVQPFPELVHVIELRCRIGGEVGGSAAEVDVIGEHADDGFVRGRAVAGKSRQQDVLLDAEVLVALLFPEAEEGVARGDGCRAGGAPEALGDDEPVVVVAGELGEGVAALHGKWREAVMVLYLVFV